MKSAAATVAHEAKFETSDFSSAKKRCCEGFKLVLGRVRPDSTYELFVAFQRGDERLDDIGHLE
jgi:hypothetical protein